MTDNKKAKERFTAKAEGLKIKNKPDVDWREVIKQLKNKEPSTKNT